MKGSNCNNETGISLPNLTYTVYAKIISTCSKRITELLNRIKHKFQGMTKYRISLVYLKLLQVIHRLHPSFKSKLWHSDDY